MKRYRKKPVVIEAVQFDGTNFDSIAAWVMPLARDDTDVGGQVGDDPHLDICTLEGTMRADPGDWIIRGVQGEFYPCKPDIFDATYEPADAGRFDR